MCCNRFISLTLVCK